MVPHSNDTLTLAAVLRLVRFPLSLAELVPTAVAALVATVGAVADVGVVKEMSSP